MLQEFKDFAIKGNVLDMAVGVIMGGAFGKIVGTFTDGIMMPFVGKLLGNVDFSQMYLNLSDKTYATLAEAQKAAAPVVTYGSLINNVIDFLIVALVMYMLVKQVNRMKPAPPPPPPPGPTPDQKLLTEIRDALVKR
jgi:large conductance mechanosensitive channel